MNFTEYKTVKKRVEAYLIAFPTLRDSDYKLIATYWRDQVGKDIIKGMSAMQLLQFLADKKVTHPENIRRGRAKIQAENTELRGLSYKPRKNEGEVFTANINSPEDEPT